MFSTLKNTIEHLDISSISIERKNILNSLIEYIQNKIDQNEEVRINFICTHNSRRSHLSQVWAQTMADYYQLININCYSGGTEATALYPKVAETLDKNGFKIEPISQGKNPIYSIKSSKNSHPIIGFSKKYDAAFNPQSNFASVMTCSQADTGCPFIAGTDIRIPITYEDPKVSDNTPIQSEVYLKRSLEIATEMKYVFSKTTTNAK